MITKPTKEKAAVVFGFIVIIRWRDYLDLD